MEDREHDARLLNDFDYWWDCEVSKKEIEAIRIVSDLLKRVSRDYENIGFSELEEML